MFDKHKYFMCSERYLTIEIAKLSLFALHLFLLYSLRLYSSKDYKKYYVSVWQCTFAFLGTIA